jgi:hypothetical protein
VKKARKTGVEILTKEGNKNVKVITKDARNKKQECKAETKNGGNDRNKSKK